MTTIVSEHQLSALMDFLEAHQEIALGRLHRTMEGRNLGKRLWEECANILNSFSLNGFHKSANGWRAYFADYKSKVLKKVKIHNASLSETGGGKQSHSVLTPLQERLYNILKSDVEESMQGVQKYPLSVTDNVKEYLSVEAGPQDYQVDPLDGRMFRMKAEHDEEEQSQGPALSEPTLSEPDLSEPTLSEPTLSEPPRNPRRRRRRPPQPPQHTNYSSALREHARAINRLAGAMERIASSLEKGPPKKRLRQL